MKRNSLLAVIFVCCGPMLILAIGARPLPVETSRHGTPTRTSSR